jgi:hypothetical protein
MHSAALGKCIQGSDQRTLAVCMLLGNLKYAVQRVEEQSVAPVARLWWLASSVRHLTTSTTGCVQDVLGM